MKSAFGCGMCLLIQLSKQLCETETLTVREILLYEFHHTVTNCSMSLLKRWSMLLGREHKNQVKKLLILCLWKYQDVNLGVHTMKLLCYNGTE